MERLARGGTRRWLQTYSIVRLWSTRRNHGERNVNVARR